MKLHVIQQKLMGISEQINLQKMSLRDVGLLVDESHPQKIRHHLDQLIKKGLIAIDEKSGKVKLMNAQKSDYNDNVVAVPIYGVADCGEAKAFAEENLEGYLRISRRLVGGVRNVFALRAQGPSMNQAKIGGRYSIEGGDYVLVNPNNKQPRNGDYVLSIINGCANIKKFLWDKKNDQIALISESTENIAPIYIHLSDNYMINGEVISVIKKSSFDELSAMQAASSQDVLADLGPISKREVEYYENL